MDHLLQISKQTFWQILGKIVTSISTFLILGIVARNFKESGTGVFTLTLTYLGIFYLLSDFGFNAHELKVTQNSKVKSQNENWQRLLGTRLIWSGLLVFLALALLPFLPFAMTSFSVSVIFGSLAIIASSVFITGNLIFQKRLRYDLSVLSSSIGTLSSLLLFFYLSQSKVMIPFLLIAHLVGWIVMALTSLLLVKKFINSIVPIFDFRYIINLLKDCWPIAATLVLNVVYFRADAFIVTSYKGLADAGIYNIAYSIFQAILVLPTFIMNAYYPLMLKSLEKLKLVAVFLVTLGLLAAISIYLSAPLIIKLVTGKGFLGSSQSLQILSLGFPAFFLSSLLMWMLVTKGHYKRMLLIYLIGLFFNLILNFYFIPYYTYYAASWITVISEYLILALQVMVLSRL